MDSLSWSLNVLPQALHAGFKKQGVKRIMSQIQKCYKSKIDSLSRCKATVLWFVCFQNI